MGWDLFKDVFGNHDLLRGPDGMPILDANGNPQPIDKDGNPINTGPGDANGLHAGAPGYNPDTDPNASWLNKGMHGVARAAGFHDPVTGSAPGASLDPQQSDQDRAAQQAYIKALQDRASGVGPMPGVDQLHDYTGKALASEMAVGQSQPGAAYTTALRTIGDAQARTRQEAAGQEGILRTNDQKAAQDQLAALTGGVQGQDYGQALADQQARQGATQLNYGLTQAGNKAFGNFVGGAGSAVTAAATGKPMSRGGPVPGKPKVFGDNEKNDTVPAKLSPGEIVIPRSIAMRPDADVAGAHFIRAVKQHGAQKLAPGGMVGPDLLGGNLNVGQPSVQNGGLLDATSLNQDRDAGTAVSDMFRARAAGAGPSAVPQQFTNATDDNIAAAMRGGAGPESSARMGAFGDAASSVAGGAAHASAADQLSASAAYAKELLARRAAALQLAQAQQHARFANTSMNAGASLEQQAMLHNILSGGAQAAATAGSTGMFGYRGDPSAMPSSGYFGDASSPDEWSNPFEQGQSQGGDGMKHARGGVISAPDRTDEFVKAIRKRKAA